MAIRSPFFTPLLLRTLANLQTSLLRLLYVIWRFRFGSFPSLLSKKILQFFLKLSKED